MDLPSAAKKSLLVALHLFLLLLIEFPARAQENTTKATPQPKAFDIHYKVSFNGLPTGIHALASLRKFDNHYLVELNAKSWLLSYHEKSTFRWDGEKNCNLQSEKYSFDFEGFKHQSFFEIEMNSEDKLAVSKWPENEIEYEIPDNISDALAYLFKLQCDLRVGNLNPEYVIAYQKGIENYIFEYMGTEILKTSFGKIETMVLKRIYSSEKYQTTYWIAPSLDYLMVKMKHKEGRVVTATLNIKEINYLAALEE